MTIAAQADCGDDCIAGNETGTKTKTEPKELAQMKTELKNVVDILARIDALVIECDGIGEDDCSELVRLRAMLADITNQKTEPKELAR